MHSRMYDSSYALVTTGTVQSGMAHPPNRFSRIFWYGTLESTVSNVSVSEACFDLESSMV